MRYTIQTSDTSLVTAIKDLPVGAIAVSIEPEWCLGHIMLRVHNGVVSLTDPERVWGNTCDIKVRPLPPGTVITLTVEDPF